MPTLWHIDDGQHLLAMSAATVAQATGWSFRGFESGAEACAVFAKLAPEDRPAVILMDYFIAQERGDEVTRQLRRIDPAPGRTHIVGYSSMTRASLAIVAAGGNLVLPKHGCNGINQTLLAWLLRWPG